GEDRRLRGSNGEIGGRRVALLPDDDRCRRTGREGGGQSVRPGNARIHLGCAGALSRDHTIRVDRAHGRVRDGKVDRADGRADVIVRRIKGGGEEYLRLALGSASAGGGADPEPRDAYMRKDCDGAADAADRRGDHGGTDGTGRWRLRGADRGRGGRI